MEETTAFHEVTVLNEFVTHEATVRSDGSWIGVEPDNRWHTVRATFDTYGNTVRVWINPHNGNPPDITKPFTLSKSELKVLSMEEILDWLLLD